MKNKENRFKKKDLRVIKKGFLYIKELGDYNYRFINLWKRPDIQNKIVCAVLNNTECSLLKIEGNRYFVETEKGSGWVSVNAFFNKKQDVK